MISFIGYASSCIYKIFMSHFSIFIIIIIINDLAISWSARVVKS